MDYQGTESIIIRDDEFLLMLAAAGIEEWYGISLAADSKEIEDPIFVNRSLANLYRKDLIDWGNTGAKVSEMMKEILLVLRDSDTCITVRRVGKPGDITGCYFSGGKAVTIERNQAGEDELRLSIMETDDWIADLEKNEFYPIVAEAMENITEPFIPELVTVLTRLEVPSGERLAEIRLYDQGISGIISLAEGEKERTLFFNVDYIRSILYEWAGGKK